MLNRKAFYAQNRGDSRKFFIFFGTTFVYSVRIVYKNYIVFVILHVYIDGKMLCEKYFIFDH